jgi:hypothetical protein
MKALFSLFIHFYPSNISERLPAPDSPNSLLFGLLGLLLIGVTQALCQIAWTTDENADNKLRQV